MASIWLFGATNFMLQVINKLNKKTGTASNMWLGLYKKNFPITPRATNLNPYLLLQRLRNTHLRPVLKKLLLREI
jgi:hypothetical protein